MSAKPVTITQRRFGFIKRRLTVLKNGILAIRRSSPIETCEWQIDLAHINPTFRRVKTYSGFWLSVLAGCGAGMLVVLLAYLVNNNAELTEVTFIKNFTAYLLGAASSLFFLLRSWCHHTYFYYELEGDPFAFSLYSDTPAKAEYQGFVNDVVGEIRKARMAAKTRDWQQVKSAIELLRKEKVISETVTNVLHYRFEDLTYFTTE